MSDDDEEHRPNTTILSDILSQNFSVSTKINQSERLNLRKQNVLILELLPKDLYVTRIQKMSNAINFAVKDFNPKKIEHYVMKHEDFKWVGLHISSLNDELASSLGQRLNNYSEISRLFKQSKRLFYVNLAAITDRHQLSLIFMLLARYYRVNDSNVSVKLIAANVSEAKDCLNRVINYWRNPGQCCWSKYWVKCETEKREKEDYKLAMKERYSAAQLTGILKKRSLPITAATMPNTMKNIKKIMPQGIRDLCDDRLNLFEKRLGTLKDLCDIGIPSPVALENLTEIKCSIAGSIVSLVFNEEERLISTVYLLEGCVAVYTALLKDLLKPITLPGEIRVQYEKKYKAIQGGSYQAADYESINNKLIRAIINTMADKFSPAGYTIGITKDDSPEEGSIRKCTIYTMKDTEEVETPKKKKQKTV